MGSSCSKGSYSRRESRKELVNSPFDDDNMNNSMDNDTYENAPANATYMESNHSPTEQFWSADSQKGEVLQFRTYSLKRDALLSNMVEVPQGYDEYYWIYKKSLFYLDECQLVFESISDYCNPHSCPEMTAGPHYTYLWTDDIHREPISMPACHYISNIFIWIHNVYNSKPFSNISKGEYPENFMCILRIVYKKLFRVYAHVYHHHLNEFIKQNAEVHLNTSFKYFGLFIREYELISKKEEAPLRKLLETLMNETEDSHTVALTD